MRFITPDSKLIIPYFISIVFVGISINSIARGIDHHETWRIVIASIGGSFFLLLAILTVVKFIKLRGLKKKRPKKRLPVETDPDALP